MKKKVISFFMIGMFCSILSYGQNNVLLVNGNSLNSSSVIIEKESVKLNVNGETRSISKDDILCVISERGKSYTFCQKKNNKKLKIVSRDISNDYQGADKARLFAYKYYKTDPDIAKLYKLNMDNSVTLEEFESVYIMQHQMIKSRATISSVIVSVVVILVVVPAVVRTLKGTNTLSY